MFDNLFAYYLFGITRKVYINDPIFSSNNCLDQVKDYLLFVD
jgi:hypothetical protein